MFLLHYFVLRIYNHFLSNGKPEFIPGNMCVNSSHRVKPLPDPFLAPSTYNSEHIENYIFIYLCYN